MNKVSIIVIAYNIENYIDKCLSSVLNQTYKDIEVIVVNDGSTDETLKRICSISLFDKRVKVIDKQNEGPMVARKEGFDNATGEYVLFVDGDDWLDQQAIEKLIERANYKRSDILLYNYFVTNKSTTNPCKSYNNRLIKEKNNLESAMLCYISPSVWTKLIRRDFLLENNIEFPSFAYAEDLAFTVSMFSCNPEIDFLEENLYYYFQRNDSITKSNDIKVMDSLKSINYIKKQLIERELIEKYQDEFIYLAFTHTYFNHVICTDKYTKIQKNMYYKWKEMGISLKANEYYINFLKRNTIGVKLKISIFDISYNSGVLFTYFRRLVPDFFQLRKKYT
ncbi:glycosyl transferase [Mycobacteroides abscessus subsp. abscessus]|nr:glycosyl transferase [Mycobacteroides abscessus subsp. abscessus]